MRPKAIVYIMFMLVVVLAMSGPGGCAKKDPLEPKKQKKPAEWKVQTHNLTNKSLRDIWVGAYDRVFAVGDEGKILQYDGTTWDQMSSRTLEDLRGIWGRSLTEIYACGANGTVIFYNGQEWDNVTPGSVTPNDLVDVWGCADYLFVVEDVSWAVYQFDGGSWTSITSGGADFPPYAMWVADCDNLFHVGKDGQAMEWNRTNGWRFMSGPGDTLRAIWGSSKTDIFAAGDDGNITHYDGNADRVWITMTDGILDHLHGVWGSSGRDVYVVGETGTIAHYDGAGWTKITGPTTLDLFGVSGAASDNVFACGASGVIVRYGR